MAISVIILIIGIFVFIYKMSTKLGVNKQEFLQGLKRTNYDDDGCYYVVGMRYHGIDFPIECDAVAEWDELNQHDDNAIAIYSKEGHYLIGYISKETRDREIIKRVKREGCVDGAVKVHQGNYQMLAEFYC